MRRRRLAAWIGLGIAILGLLVLGGVLILTNTDWGRERVRGFALDRIEQSIDGQVEIGRIEGNLLRRARLIDVAIRDRQGRPLLEADTLETRFGLRALLRQRIELTGLRVVRAHILLDKPPGEEWNYVRILPVDPEDVEPGPPGWGDWVALDDVSLIDSRVTVRTEWQPPDDLTPAEREAAIRHALAGDTREHVVEVPGGYQNVMEFRELDAALPRVLVAHPDTAGVAFEVASFSGLVRPFSPPPARVHDLSGQFRVVNDSLFMSGVRAVLPDSRLSGGGVYALHAGDLLLIALADPVAFADLRWIHPPLPAEGGGSMAMRLELGSVVNRIVLLDMDVAIGDATVAGRLDLTTGDTLRFGETDLRFARVETGLIEELLETDLPRQGEMTGRLALEGPPGALTLDGDVRFEDVSGASSRVLAEGQLGVDPDLRFRQLRLEFRPLQAELARAAVPDLPLRGTIEGTMALTGRPDDLDLEGDLALRDPRHGLSRVQLAGGLDTREEPRLRDMVVRMDPLRVDLLRDEVPELPAGAAATGRIVLNGVPTRALRVDGEIRLDDPTTGVSEIAATGGLGGLDDGLSFEDLRLRVDPLRVDLVRPWLPELPAGGSLVGAMELNGDPTGMLHVDGQLAHYHEELGESRFVARGGIGLGDPIQFRELDVRLEPLQLALVDAFAPELPLAGTLTGTARLNGSPESRIAVRGDLVHEEAGERSHVVGSAEVTRGPGGWAAVDVRLQPLSLDVAGRFVPAAGLQGSVAGQLEVSGDLDDLRVDADLRATDGGVIRAAGTLDLAAPAPAYDLDLRLTEFDLSAVTWRAPAETDLTGVVAARGQGLDPATMNATVTADLTQSGVGDVAADLVRLRLALDDGLARFDSSIVRLDGAEAVVDGAFGLVAGREGTLAYRVAVDSLHPFAPWLPGADTAVGRPLPGPDPDLPTPVTEIAETMPAPAAPDVAAATAGDEPVRRYVAPDGARVVETTTLVQTSIERRKDEPRRATVAVAGDTAAVDTVTIDPAVDTVATDRAAFVAADTLVPPTTGLRAPSDSLAGSLRAAGTLSGNVTRFDVDGRAVVDELLYRGTYVGAAEAEYAVADAGTTSPDIRLVTELRDVRTGEVALDSVSARGRYLGLRGEGTGEAVIVAHGTDDTEYRADAEFDFSPEESELRIADLMLRVDTATWTLTQPGVVSWADNAIQLARIDVVSDLGGRVRLDGRLPVEGTGDLDILVEDLEIAQLMGLLQRPEEAEGRLNLDANVQGTLETPRLSGTARLEDGRLDGREVPNARASFRYVDQELTADATLEHEGRILASAEARVPIDLSLIPDIAPRLLPGDLAIDVEADSLPLEAVPELSEQLTDPQGRARGTLAVRGTVDDPVVTGEVNLDLASVGVVPLGLQLEDVAGALRVDGERVRVDSLVARSGGPIRVTGEIGIASLTDPTFELDIETRETLVIDTEDVQLHVDADLVVGGSFATIEVGGEVRTRRGVIYIPRLSELGATEVVSLHSPISSERIEEEFLRELRLPGQRRPLLERLDLDVALQIDRDVWLRSTEANIEIYTPPEIGALRIRVDPATSRLALEGTVNTDRGEYEFMSRRFQMTRGAATFTADPAIDPILQIAAEHQVRLPGREAFDIRVLLGGTLRDPEITLESTAQPPIAQTDLLSYLAFGRDAATLIFREGSALSAQGGDAGELVGNVAGLATQQLGTIAVDAVVNDLEAELMRDLNVDVFRITPADLPPDMFTGRYVDLLRSSELEAGRYISSRLFVAGQITTGGSRPGVRFEYEAPFGLEWRASWRSRWMPVEPTLTEQDPQRAGVFGSFLLREWRF